MSRRRLLTAALAAVCLIALSASAVALAHSSGGDGSSHPRHHAQRTAERSMWATALKGVAQRLDVAPADLRAAVKAVAREQRGQRETDLAAQKTAWIDGLATKLNKTPDAVAAAVRAELEAQLTKAVGRGWITPQGETIALACFDDPAGCDLKALRAQITAFGGGGKSTKKHRPCRRHHSGDGRMTPGGRSTSAPLT